MAANSTKTKNTVPVRLTAVKAGVDKDFTPKTTLQAGGTAYTQSSLDAKIDLLLAPYIQLDAAKSALKVAEQAVKAAEPGTKLVLKNVETALKGMYGVTNPILVDFGIALPKPPPTLTPTQHLQRAVKAADTRRLRGTKGPKQLAAIKSTLQVDVSTAPTATAANAGAASGTGAPAPAPVAASISANPAETVPVVAPTAAVAK